MNELISPIKEYLEHQPKWAFTSIDGQVFCAFDPLGVQEGHGQDRLYIWVYCREFTATSDPKKEGSGSSGPAVLLLDEERNIVGHQAPGEGEAFPHHIRAMFPEALVDEVLAYHSPDKKPDSFLPALPQQQASEAFERSDL